MTFEPKLQHLIYFSKYLWRTGLIYFTIARTLNLNLSIIFHILTSFYLLSPYFLFSQYHSYFFSPFSCYLWIHGYKWIIAALLHPHWQGPRPEEGTYSELSKVEGRVTVDIINTRFRIPDYNWEPPAPFSLSSQKSDNPCDIL